MSVSVRVRVRVRVRVSVSVSVQCECVYLSTYICLSVRTHVSNIVIMVKASLALPDRFFSVTALID